MRVFVTGATGFVGSAIVREQIGSGHEVLGLARSAGGADALQAAGAKVHLGDVTNLESLRSGVAISDGVIHTAFNHDFSTFMENCEEDRRAIEILGSAREGSDRPLIVTSGIAMLSPTGVATEKDTVAAANPRKSESAAEQTQARGVNTSVVRLPPSVHGDGDHGFIPMLIGMAHQKQVSAYVNDGENLWSAVHRLDAAVLFRLALEKSERGARYHAVAEDGIPFKEIADVIGHRLNLQIMGKTLDEANQHFTWFLRFAAGNFPASSEWTREQLGWRPQHPGLIADIDRPSYFAA